MKKIIILSLAMAALFAVSCQKEYNEEVSEKLVTYNIGIGIDPATKTVLDTANLSLQFEVGDKIMVYWMEINGGTTSYNSKKATVSSVDDEGKAILSVELPANVDSLMAVMNPKEEAKTPFKYKSGSIAGENRVHVGGSQADKCIAVPNGIHKERFPLVARWDKSEASPVPEFTFTPLCCLLKFTVNNLSDIKIDSISFGKMGAYDSKAQTFQTNLYWKIKKDGTMNFKGSSYTHRIFIEPKDKAKGIENATYYILTLVGSTPSKTNDPVMTFFYQKDSKLDSIVFYNKYRTDSTYTKNYVTRTLGKVVNIGTFTIPAQTTKSGAEISKMSGRDW